MTYRVKLGAGALTLLAVILSASLGIADTGVQSPDTENTYASPVRPEIWPLGERLPRDAGEKAAVEAILSRLSVAQKVGQVIQADSASVTPREVRKYRLGSILSGGNSAPGPNPYASAEEWLRAADAYFEASIDPRGVEVAVPVMWGIDAVHGHTNVVGGTVFPHNIGLGAANDPEQMRKIGAVVAREMRVTGHDWTFAPTIAVPQDDRWGRTYEGISENPAVVAAYAVPFVEGLQGQFGTDGFLKADRVIATAKHYLADGGTQNGRDQGDAIISEEALRDIHGAGYPPAINAGVQAVMASFSSWNGRKIHGDKGLLTDVLRKRLAFDGLVVGDWNAHGQIPGCTNESCPIAFNAGLDMFMAPDSWRELYANTLAQVKSGEITMARLDEAVRRILRVKYRAGILTADKPSKRPFAGDTSLLAAPEHRAVARDAVRKSLVLLKNADGVLPLDPKLTVLVAGDGADNIGKQSGGWTLSWQGGLDNDLFPNGTSIFAGIQEAVEAADGQVALSADGTYREKPDVAIVVFGEEPYAEFRGDIDTLSYSARRPNDLALLRRLKAEGIPVVSVFLSGRPLWVNPEINASDAFVAAWLPGSEGAGVADVLFRKPDGTIGYDFKGRLPNSWPAEADHFEANVVGGKHKPLFAFGYGLRYASPTAVGPLSEVDATTEGGAERGVILARGRAQAPWYLAIRDTSGDVSRLASRRDSRAGINLRPIDKDAQEDALSVEFTETAQDSVFLILGDDTVDVTREANGGLELAVTLRAEGRAGANVGLGMTCSGQENCGGWLQTTADALGGGAWSTVRISLSCFVDNGLTPTAVRGAFALRSDAPFRLDLADIRLVEDADGAQTCIGTTGATSVQ